MKNSLLIPLSLLITSLTLSQEIVPVSGGNANGNGSVSYTVGQVFVGSNTGNDGSISEGIQQSIELFVLSNPELKTINLNAITFPNPTKDKIILSLTDNVLNNLIFTIFDIKGRLVKNGKVNKDKTSIAMKDFTTGVYLLKVYQKNKQLKTFKIIKN